MQSSPVRTVGRAACVSPANRFERVHAEADFEHLADAGELPDVRRLHTQFLPDNSPLADHAQRQPGCAVSL